jgi:CubicO group peptidase (beta-lactamase class C family)
MIRTSNILLFIALLLGSCDSTQKIQTSWQKKPLTIGKPESQGFSSERLRRIDLLFHEFVEQHKIAGATALIARRGKIVYYRSNGYSDLENQIPLEKDAIFRIASQTKAITSVAVMMLYEEGRISLNNPISMFLPEFRHPQVITTFNKKDSSYTYQAAKREVTIHDLLTHTSGYCYPGSGGEALNAIYSKLKIVNGVPDAISSLKKEMQKIALAPLAHEPGEKFSYGLSTDILGYMVETLSGQSLENFLRTRIFDPLGMTDTYFQLPEEKYARLLPLYQDAINGDGIQKSTGKYIDYPMRKGVYYSGGGGLSSTALDYSKFLQMLLNEGEYNGIRLLSRKTIGMMRVNQIGTLGSGSIYIPNSNDKFGLGFEVVTLPGKALVPISEGSFGWGGAFGSLYWIDPGEDLIVQLVIQKTGNYTDIRSKFITAVYQAIE